MRVRRISTLKKWVNSSLFFLMATVTYVLEHESECSHSDKVYASTQRLLDNG